MIENLLIIDTETTGFSHKDSKLIEVGCLYYNIPSKSVLHEVATLLNHDSNAAYEINKIDPVILQKVNKELSAKTINHIGELMLSADIIIAHYAKFDKEWLDNYAPLSAISKNCKWKCSKVDIAWKKGPGLKLQEIAAHLNVDYLNAHRALADCRILLKCFQKLQDFDEQVGRW